MLSCLPFSFYFLDILLYSDTELLDWFFIFFPLVLEHLILCSNPFIELFIFNFYEPLSPFVFNLWMFLLYKIWETGNLIASYTYF